MNGKPPMNGYYKPVIGTFVVSLSKIFTETSGHDSFCGSKYPNVYFSGIEGTG